jgi:hypothetical protein
VVSLQYADDTRSYMTNVPYIFLWKVKIPHIFKIFLWIIIID